MGYKRSTRQTGGGTAYRNWLRQFGGATSRAQHRGAALAKVWHDFLRKQLHGAEYLVVLHATECKVAAEVGDALLLEFLDLGHTGVGSAEDSAVLRQGLIARW